jgi:hypothetical protein
MSLVRREFARPSGTAFLAPSPRPFIYSRKIAILDLTARDIDNELGGLAEIAGALQAFMAFRHFSQSL